MPLSVREFVRLVLRLGALDGEQHARHVPPLPRNRYPLLFGLFSEPYLFITVSSRSAQVTDVTGTLRIGSSFVRRGGGAPRRNRTADPRKALAEGDRGILKIASEFGVGSGTVQRIKAEMATAAD